MANVQKKKDARGPGDGSGHNDSSIAESSTSKQSETKPEEEDAGARKWQAFYTQYAMDFIAQNVNSKEVAKKIFKYRELLEYFPDLGAPYNPSYPAAIPPFPCRSIAVPDTPFTLYYLKENELQRVVVFCIDFQRVEPNARFSQINWDVIGF